MINNYLSANPKISNILKNTIGEKTFNSLTKESRKKVLQADKQSTYENRVFVDIWGWNGRNSFARITQCKQEIHSIATHYGATLDNIGTGKIDLDDDMASIGLWYTFNRQHPPGN